MRPDKYQRSRVTPLPNDQDYAAEAPDRRDVPARSDPRLSPALPEDRHRQVQWLLHRARFPN